MQFYPLAGIQSNTDDWLEAGLKTSVVEMTLTDERTVVVKLKHSFGFTSIVTQSALI